MRDHPVEDLVGRCARQLNRWFHNRNNLELHVFPSFCEWNVSCKEDGSERRTPDRDRELRDACACFFVSEGEWICQPIWSLLKWREKVRRAPFMPLVIFTGSYGVSRPLTWFCAFVAQGATLAYCSYICVFRYLIRREDSWSEQEWGIVGLLQYIFLIHSLLFCEWYLTHLEIRLLEVQICRRKANYAADALFDVRKYC
jgi:hypothetical protein